MDTAPTDVAAGVVAQLFASPDPDTFQVTLPVGAVAPVGPVTVNV